MTHRKKLSLVVDESESLSFILPAKKIVNLRTNYGWETKELRDAYGFWIPRTEDVRKRLNVERALRSRCHVVLPPPAWLGDARPKGARRFRPSGKPAVMRTKYPTPTEMRRLASLGYPKSSLAALFARAHLPHLKPKPDRFKGGSANPHDAVIGRHRDALADSEHSYNPSAPALRTTFGGGYKKEEVTSAIAKHHWDDAHSKAVFDVVFLRRKPFYVAASLGLKLTTVYRYCSRIRAELKMS